MTIYLARHTEVDKPEGKVILRTPGYHLSQKGKTQAVSLAAFLVKQNTSIKGIFSSPLERCLDTIEIIERTLNLSFSIEVREYLNKWDKGEKSEAVSERMNKILDEVKDGDLIVSHHDNIQVFVNKLKNEPLLQTDLHCQYGSLYALEFNGQKLLKDFKLLFTPKQ